MLLEEAVAFGMGNCTNRVKFRVWGNSYSCKSQVGDTQINPVTFSVNPACLSPAMEPEIPLVGSNSNS